VTTAELLTHIEGARIKADVVPHYAKAIRDRTIDWPTVNKAIMARWSMSALYDIKQAAWKIVEGKA